MTNKQKKEFDAMLNEVVEELGVQVEVEETTVEPKAKAAKKTQAIEVNTYDPSSIPDEVTPSHLDSWFGFGDGGKTIRRHLRKYFATDSAHGSKEKWSWTKGSPQLQNILDYFTSKYGAPKFENYIPKEPKEPKATKDNTAKDKSAKTKDKSAKAKKTKAPEKTVGEEIREEYQRQAALDALDELDEVMIVEEDEEEIRIEE